MTIKPSLPQIDQRGLTEIASQLRQLIINYFGGLWPTDENVLQDSKLNSLVNIFSRFMEITIGKVNSAPRKNFLTFLNTLGFTLTAPQSARTALQFKPVKKSAQNFIFVPQSIQVTGQGTDEKPVFFETESRLTVVTPEICDIRSIAGSIDRTCNHTDKFLGKDHEFQELFTGNDLIPHRLYIGDNRLFSFDKPSDVTLEITTDTNCSIPSYVNPEEDILVKWLLFTGNSAKKDAKPVSDYEETEADFIDIENLIEKDKTGEFPIVTMGDGNPLKKKDSRKAINLFLPNTTFKITFKNVPSIPIKKVQGFTSEGDSVHEWNAPWIIAQLRKPLVDIRFPGIKEIKAVSQLVVKKDKQESLIQKSENIVKYLPDAAFYNTIELDCTKDFYPFGERPKTFDTFYIANDHIFEKVGAIITITFAISNGIENIKANNINLMWEYSNGQQWKIFNNVDNQKGIINSGDLCDDTDKFIFNPDKSIRKVIFKCPEIDMNLVNGQEHRWIRVRITKGDYGTDATYAEFVVPGNYKVIIMDDGNLGKEVHKDAVIEKQSLIPGDQIIYIPVQSTFAPPVLSNLTLEFIPKPRDVNFVLASNNYFFSYTRDLSNNDLQSTGGSYVNGFIPFIRPVEDTMLQNSLYLAFSSSIAGLPLSLLFPLIANESMVWSEQPIPPILAWEYWNGKKNKWMEIAVDDKTQNLTQREIILYPIPEDAKPVACFRKQLYWIRARLTAGEFPIIPVVNGIFLNTVWARHQTTINKQIWGSSTGGPSQQVTIPSLSLLEECSISIREVGLTDDQADKIMTEEGADAVENVALDALGNVTERWIRWRKVDNFYASFPDSRHYVIDRVNNLILFGDGKNGMIPPQGRNSIRCDFCRFGGGTSGNVTAGSLTKLCTSIPYIDSVNNPIAAEGGIDLETYEMLEQRAPYSLRNQDRAVTSSDFEAIIKRASSKVARVKCLSAMDPLKIKKPGWVTALVVPVGEDVRPVPSMDLFDAINRYVQQRYAVNLYQTTPAPVNLVAPFYLKVKATIIAFAISTCDIAYVKQLIDRRIRRYFHANHGGFDEQGWEFGRHVYKSELFQILENIKDVDHVHEIKLQANVQVLEITAALPLIPSRSYPDHSPISFQDGNIKMILAEPVNSPDSLNKQLSASKQNPYSFRATGFIEGDRVEIANSKSLNLHVTTVIPDLNNPIWFQLLCNMENESFTETMAGNITEILINNGKDNVKLLFIKSLAEKNQIRFFVEVDINYYGYNHIDLSGYYNLNIKYKQPVIVTVTDIKHNQSTNDTTLSFSPIKTEYTFKGGSNGFTDKTAVITNISDTSYRKIQSYCVLDVSKEDGRISKITIAAPKKDDCFSITHREWTSESLQGFITSISEVNDIVYLEENYLVYAGDPYINLLAPGQRLETEDNSSNSEQVEQDARYLLNTNPLSFEVHDLLNAKPQCNINRILQRNKVYLSDLKEIKSELTTNKYDYCAYCFGKDKSRK